MAEWFAAKRYGLGAGLPIAWQGWAILGAYVAVIGGTLMVLGERNPAVPVIFGIATLVLLFVVARTTRGGWRWRWGRED